MDREDAGHASEPQRDEKRPEVTHVQRRARDEERDERRDDRDVRRDHEVLEPDRDRLIPRGIGEEPCQQNAWKERHHHHG